MTLMSFDSAPEHPRDVWLHTVRGWIIALRRPDKPYPVLPSCQHRRATDLVRAVYEQTGLVIETPSLIRRHVAEAMVYDSEVLAGSLRPSSTGTPVLVHPSEFACSPDIDIVRSVLGTTNPGPLKVSAVSVRPEDVMVGDRRELEVSGVRLELTDNGPTVALRYESYAQATLGADDELHGDDTPPVDPDADEKSRGKKSAPRIGDTALGQVWTPPMRSVAGLRVYRLGGDLRGEST